MILESTIMPYGTPLRRIAMSVSMLTGAPAKSAFSHVLINEIMTTNATSATIPRITVIIVPIGICVFLFLFLNFFYFYAEDVGANHYNFSSLLDVEIHGISIVKIFPNLNFTRRNKHSGCNALAPYEP